MLPFAQRMNVVSRSAIMVLAAALVLCRNPVAAQAISSADSLVSPAPINNGSTVVPIQTPEQVLARPFRSIANVVRGEQTVRTRNGVGFRVVSVQAEDEIWLVSARQQNDCELGVRRLVNGAWVTAGMADLTNAHAVDRQKSSLIYVHGNRTDEEYARSRGLQFYENVFNGESRTGPVRFVIFAWRSERERIRPTTDFNVKLDRSVELGPTFANFVDRFHDRRIVLAGFSLGGQIVLSGLGQLQAQSANFPEEKEGKFQVALITPALKAEQASASVAPLPLNPVTAKTVVFINQKDNAIRAATLISKATSKKPAVTLEQVAGHSDCKALNPIVIEDITAEVSSCHSISKYSAKSLRLQMVVNAMASEVRGGFGATTCPDGDLLPLGEFVEVAEQVDGALVNENRLD